MNKFILCLCFLLGACATSTTTLTNDKGEKYRCDARGYGIVTLIIAKHMFEKCKAEARAAGYKE